MVMNLQPNNDALDGPVPALAGPRSPIRRLSRQGWPRIIGGWLERRRQRSTLRELDDRMLKDIGLTRAEAAQEAAKPFWR